MAKENLTNEKQHPEFYVAGSGDVSRARIWIKSYVLDEGFSEIESDEIALAVSELATNLHKYAGGGELIAQAVTKDSRKGIMIETIDHGPGIRDVEMAMTDGFSTSTSLGYGLGTVNRVMDTLDIETKLNLGTHITCVRWKDPDLKPTEHSPMTYGVATRPHPQMKLNGDAYVVKHWGSCLLVSVIDGLGHGQYAYRASLKAREYIEKHYKQPIEDIFRGVSRNCFGTRGVVMAIACFDWKRRTLTFASIGNIEVKTFGNVDMPGLIIRRGIIGVNAPKPVVVNCDWDPDNTFIMHSDGLSTHWSREDYMKLYDSSAFTCARNLLMQFGKENDDATVIVIKRREDDD